MTKEKKTKNYILSNNVVINLAGLISKRKSSNKPKSSQKDTQDTIGRTTPFTNISNLDTQIQQANLRTAENRFQNSSRLPSDTSRTTDIPAPKIERTTLPDDRFREGNPYYDPNDNAGSFGTIQGSDTFPSQGNNVPIHENNSDGYSYDDYSLGPMSNDDSSLSSVSTSTLNPNNSNQSGDQRQESEEYILERGKVLERGRTYTKNEIKLWLDNNKRINPKRPLKRPTPDGREYGLLTNPTGKIYTDLTKDAIAYGLL